MKKLDAPILSLLKFRCFSRKLLLPNLVRNLLLLLFDEKLGYSFGIADLAKQQIKYNGSILNEVDVWGV